MLYKCILTYFYRVVKEKFIEKEQAEQYKITFGKHAGKTIKELVEKDIVIGYIKMEMKL